MRNAAAAPPQQQKPRPRSRASPHSLQFRLRHTPQIAIIQAPKWKCNKVAHPCMAASRPGGARTTPAMTSMIVPECSDELEVSVRRSHHHIRMLLNSLIGNSMICAKLFIISKCRIIIGENNANWNNIFILMFQKLAITLICV